MLRQSGTRVEDKGEIQYPPKDPDSTSTTAGDARTQDLSPADVITIYMTRYAMQKLQARLEKFLRDGTRLVVCMDELPGQKPSQTISATADNNRTYQLRLYVFSRQEGWTSFSKFGERR